MGYIDLEHWRDLVRRHTSDIAAAQKIAPENIRWYAAFHNKESNPHVHIVVYSENPHEGYLTNNGIEKIRSAFANDIYKDELQNLYQQQTAVRDKLRSEAESVMKDLLSELQSNSQVEPQLEQLVLKLQSQLRNSKGKKVYGYLQPNIKKTVDQIVTELAKNPVLKKMYDEWCALEQQKYETYTSAVQKFPPLEKNKVFKPIKNIVIRAVLAMDFLEPNIETEMIPDDEILLSEDFGNTKFRENMERYNLTAAQNAVISMLFSFGRLISDDYNRSLHGQRLRTEHKLKAAIRRKKQALGLKENPLENPQFRE